MAQVRGGKRYYRVGGLRVCGSRVLCCNDFGVSPNEGRWQPLEIDRYLGLKRNHGAAPIRDYKGIAWRNSHYLISLNPLKTYQTSKP